MSEETVIVKLKKPHVFVIGKKEVKELTELTMRKPLIIDQIMACKKSDCAEEQESMLMAALCGVKHDDFAKMPLSNYKAFTTAFKSFFQEDDDSTKTSDTALSNSQE